jgi:hypothetical protein
MPYLEHMMVSSVLAGDQSEAAQYQGACLTIFCHLGLVYWFEHREYSPLMILGWKDIYRLLSESRALEATDPRDKIFGLRGLSCQLWSVLPSPDYSRSPAEVFTQVTKAFLKEFKSLHILSQAARNGNALNCPSWVTDWSVQSMLVPSLMNNSWNAAKDSEASYEISCDDKELRVRGKVIDSVKRISVNLAEYQFSFTHRKSLLDTESYRLGLSLKGYSTGEDIRDVVWRTLYWGQGRAFPEDQILFEKLLELTSVPTIKEGEDAINLAAVESMFDRGFGFGAPLCTTSNGFLTYVPYTTKYGDCIPILTGRRILFIFVSQEIIIG